MIERFRAPQSGEEPRLTRARTVTGALLQRAVQGAKDLSWGEETPGPVRTELRRMTVADFSSLGVVSYAVDSGSVVVFLASSSNGDSFLSFLFKGGASSLNLKRTDILRFSDAVNPAPGPAI